MIWGDKRLQNLIDIGMIENTYDGSVNPASINLRLGNTFLKPKKDQTVMLGEEMAYDRYEFEDGQHVCIMPGRRLSTLMCLSRRQRSYRDAAPSVGPG